MRPSLGRVVKPIWLFTTACTCRPVVYAFRSAICRVSMTIPWPANLCVTVNPGRQDRVALNALLTVDVLLSADDTLEHGVCSLKVRGLAAVHLSLLTGIGGEDTLGTEVVLHVTGATLVRCCGAGELTENLSVGLTSNVGQRSDDRGVPYQWQRPSGRC